MHSPGFSVSIQASAPKACHSRLIYTDTGQYTTRTEAQVCDLQA